jgi:4-hydroxybenzoate polyprenyltransferase
MTDPYQKHFSERWKRTVRPEGDTPVFKLAIHYGVGFVAGFVAATELATQTLPAWLEVLVFFGVWIFGWELAIVIYIRMRDYEERIK